MAKKNAHHKDAKAQRRYSPLGVLGVFVVRFLVDDGITVKHYSPLPPTPTRKSRLQVFHA